MKETERSLLCSQDPAIGHYLQPDELSPHSHNLFI
jgi:hypothetical protein